MRSSFSVLIALPYFAIKSDAIDGVNHAREVGGQGCTQLQQTVINEELGKATGALWAVVWHPAVPLKHGSAEQIRDYLIPSCLGRRRACVGCRDDSDAIRRVADPEFAVARDEPDCKCFCG